MPYNPVWAHNWERYVFQFVAKAVAMTFIIVVGQIAFLFSPRKGHKVPWTRIVLLTLLVGAYVAVLELSRMGTPLR